jgi:hypothetical protein
MDIAKHRLYNQRLVGAKRVATDGQQRSCWLLLNSSRYASEGNTLTCSLRHLQASDATEGPSDQDHLVFQFNADESQRL